ncbi:cAMP and cAMP-inhibited cGMP 3',5'-cyclic phosphodiesterase 10A-like isoform X1 [Anthonomus grandis grandis]|uniref:cAMP and cAMP-inhibited cGMP 3',5'-cyclic phosphodiesterase 10A-like isoform X1 n=1 Tax=Anthonomus grandis grandis TaxID=2921223 RepID=UPI0021669C0D|nr:cAMP and cAMP-inhibited cGMP 3',5'-cyclic phosphodiesterase 10A-like isoform X1 [Anthonomus grandis grandis]
MSKKKPDKKEIIKDQMTLDTTDKATRRVIAPYVKIVRKSRTGLDKTKESQKFSFYLQNKPSVLMQDLSSFLSDSVDLASVLQETAEVLKVVTKAGGVTLYMVDTASEEIFQVPKNVTDERHKVNWKIQKGSTVAAYVAYKKEFILVDDILCDERFPAGLGYQDDMVKSVLCVPIVTTDGDCYAIVEMYRTIPDVPFNKDDLKISIVVSGWMGAAIHQNRLRLALQKQQELNDYLLDLIKCYFADNVSLEKLISEIVKFAKATLGAERGAFFIIDPESSDMTAEVFDEGIDGTSTTMHKKNIKVRLSKDRSIPGLVARTGVTVNLRDAYNDPRFFTEVEAKTGFITRSILCMPIVSVDNILGVVQVVNKINGVVFTASDENLFKTFSVYCALALHYAKLNDKMRRTDLLNESNLQLLSLQIRPCIHDSTSFAKIPEIDIPGGFSDFRWYISVDEEPVMPQMVYYMIKTIVGFEQINLYNLREFILTVRKCYRANPYHNWEHAFNVAHCMYNICLRNMELFNDVELKSLIIACVCHDLDHGGYTNNFLQLTDHTLSQLYDESFLENHHYQVATLIYKVFPFYDIPDKVWQLITTEIKQCILATDLANYFKIRMKLIQILNEQKIDWSNRHHRHLCKAIMMTSCDLSGSCKPYMIAKTLTDNVIKEFYNQGDKEKAMGLNPLSLMDREKSSQIPEDQVNFLTIIVLPCTDLLKSFLPNCADLSAEATILRKTWQEIIDLKGRKSWRQDDSVVNPIE